MLNSYGIVPPVYGTEGAFSRGEDLSNGIEKADSSAVAVTELWKWINFEIKNTGRDRIWKNVGKWFEEFGYGSLLQQRGRVGYLAVLPLRYLHLLVFLAVEALESHLVTSARRARMFYTAIGSPW